MWLAGPLRRFTAWVLGACLSICLAGGGSLLAQPAPISPAQQVTPTDALDLRIHLHDVDPERMAPLQKIAQDAVDSVQRYLNMRLHGQLDLDFVGSEAAFAQVMSEHHVQGWDERWLAGLALLDQRRVIVHVNGTRALTTRETVEHELVHTALHATGAGKWLPRWYQEGVATLLAGEATWERLRDIAGAAPLGQLESLHALDHGFAGSQVAVERAYAASAGFLRFCTARAGGQNAVGQLQQRLVQGMGFESAFALTFGGQPEALYAAWASQMQASASSWAMLLSDSAIWSLVSLLAMVSMLQAWRHRPRFDDELEPADAEPLDLEAVAAEAQAARRRPWQVPDFALPMQADPPPVAAPEATLQTQATDAEIAAPIAADDPSDATQLGWIAPETRLRPWHVRDFSVEPLVVERQAEESAQAPQAGEETLESSIDSQIIAAKPN